MRLRGVLRIQAPCTCTCTPSIDASRFALQRSLLVLAFSLHVTLHYACNSISRAFNCTPQAAISTGYEH